MATERAPRNAVVGIVVSDKMDKTITVREERMVKHPLYGKYVRRSVKYKAHDEANEAAEGDQVEILFTRPLSKTKNWRLSKVLRRSKVQAPRGASPAEVVAPDVEPEAPAAVEEVAEAPVAEAPAPEAPTTEEGTAS